MSNIWERFDDIAKPEDVMEIKSQFSKPEEGQYDVIIEELYMGESKSGMPMLRGKFRDIETNKLFFYNQVLVNLNSEWATSRNIAEALTFVEGIVNDNLEYTGLSDFAETVENVEVGTEIRIELKYNDNDFPEYTIVKKEDDEDTDEKDDFEELPF